MTQKKPEHTARYDLRAKREGEAALEETMRDAMASIAFYVTEEERQLLLLALAKLSLERPGWDDVCNRLALKFDAPDDGRARLYDVFRTIHANGAK